MTRIQNINLDLSCLDMLWLLHFFILFQARLFASGIFQMQLS